MSANIQYKTFPIAELSLAPNPRPRDSITAASIEEMASSILQQGIIQPLLARLVDGKPQIYAGQRRYLGFERALSRQAAGETAVADLSKVPVLLREVDDRTMREHQWIENLQRVDVHPRDEAVGYAELRDLYGYSMQDISRKIGKADAYVAHRLVLLKVPELLWKALDEGKVTISHLEIAGSIPNEKDREEFGKLVIAGQYGDRAMTVKEAQELKNARFAVSLRACGFDKNDEKLVQLEHKDGVRIMGGACTGCEYMSGKTNAPVCGNVRCFAAKQNAQWKWIKGNAEDCGKRCMDVDRTAELFADYGDRELRESCGLVDLGGKPSYMEMGHYNDEDVLTWEELLEGTGAMAMAITARHPKTNRVHQLLEREDAIRLAIERDPKAAAIFEKRPGVKKTKRVAGQAAASDEDDDDDDDSDGAQRMSYEQQKKIRDVRDQAVYDEFTKRLRGKWPASVKLTLVKLAAHAALCGGASDVALIVGDSVESFHQATTIAQEWEILGPKIEPDLKADDNAWLRWVAMMLIASEMGYEVFENCEGVKELASHFQIDLAGIAQSAHDAVMRPAKEELFDCEKCGGKNFTARGLKAHKCEKRQAKREAAEPAPAVDAGKVEITAEVKAAARQLYDQGLGKGAIAKQLGISENTVGNWQKREWPKRTK